jgi:predicted CXXCH cytochrome family protein
MRIALTYALLLLLGMTLVPGAELNAASTELAAKTRKCLECHARQGIIKTFENNEYVEGYINEEQFKMSVHSFLDCAECHTEFSGEKHPNRRFRSKEQFQVKSSRVCRRCHNDEEVKAKPIHANLLERETEGEAPLCVDCHSSHSIMPISGGKVTTDEMDYCISCHEHNLELHFRDGDTLPLTVDTASLSASAHSKLSCSDCHFGFSSEEHPKRNFKTRRDYGIASSESCRRCHFDKYTKTLESSCHTKQSQGNLYTPICTDCHGSHSIEYVEKDGAFSADRCRKCHVEIYEVYAESVHGMALINEKNEDVPVCIDCHKAHSIRNPLAMEFHERIPEMCSNCHADKAVVGKYGLSTDVVTSYLSDFHGVTLGLYKKERETLSRPARPIAVCTDCHGIHDIASTSVQKAEVVKANLLNRCQKCHQDATEEFPDAWLSHYKPSLSHAPFVFIVDMVYKIFLPILVVGICLQILLHIWRYAVNR